MLHFIVNYGATILISGVLLALISGIVASMLKKRKQGKSMGCNCNCGSCPGSSYCQPGEKEGGEQEP